MHLWGGCEPDGGGLCKVALWMESLEPGKPLSFLEHHIQCGNSLLGATPALLRKGIPDEAFTPIEGDDKAYCSKYKKQNKQEREKGQLTLLDERNEPWERLGDLATSLVNLNQIADDNIAGVQRKQTQYEEYVKSTPYLFSRFWADAWCAAFVWKKRQSEELLYPITDEVFRQIERNPFNAPDWMRQEVERLRDQYKFLHWHLVFPDVFESNDDKSQVDAEANKPASKTAPPKPHSPGWYGGFDVVLGNPPWERIKLQEKEWFATRRPEIAAANTATRRKLIAALQEEDPALLEAWQEDSRQAEGESHLVRNTERNPLCGRGDVNTYAIFAETNRLILGATGRVGCIVPSGIATDDTTKFFFRDLMESKALVSLYDFENRRNIFDGIGHGRFKFCLLTLTGNTSPVISAEFIFFAYDVEDLREEHRCFTLSANDLRLLNPNTGTCPIFRSSHDAELTKAIYHRVPVLLQENLSEENPWKIKFSTMFHMSSDSHLFHTFDEYILSYKEGTTIRSASDIRMYQAEGNYLPLYEAKMFHQFDHRYGDYADHPEGALTTHLPDIPAERLQDPNYCVEPRYWIEEWEVIKKTSNVPKELLQAYERKNEKLVWQFLAYWVAGYRLNHGNEKLGNSFFNR